MACPCCCVGVRLCVRGVRVRGCAPVWVRVRAWVRVRVFARVRLCGFVCVCVCVRAFVRAFRGRVRVPVRVRLRVRGCARLRVRRPSGRST